MLVYGLAFAVIGSLLLDPTRHHLKGPGVTPAALGSTHGRRSPTTGSPPTGPTPTPSWPASTTWPATTATGGAGGCSAWSTTAGDGVLDLLTRAGGPLRGGERPQHHGLPQPGADAARHRHHHHRPARRRPPPGAERGVRGYLTSGGTESLLQATRTARDWGRAERGVDPSQHGAGHQRPRRLREGGPLLRRRVPAGPGAAGRRAPTSTPWPTPSTTTPSWWSARRPPTPRG